MKHYTHMIALPYPCAMYPNHRRNEVIGRKYQWCHFMRSSVDKIDLSLLPEIACREVVVLNNWWRSVFETTNADYLGFERIIPRNQCNYYLWNGYAETAAVHSLLRYVENHAERLRGKYLAWIHDLGESRIEGKRIIDHLAFLDGLSYWWMTLFVEKSFGKSLSMTDAIRLFALEDIVSDQKPGKLKLVSANSIPA